ncbi:uncharacterized protein KIAA1143 homolog [Convolutriloba macropyga]|uniref:uncharacterized protein KIAA1143 homolog n=1 Tax=Convolutriloba macropyga TaxID=536237 RepID=UPI003F522A9B
MSKRSSVQLIERDEPSFIKKFKEKTGFVEPSNVDAKFKNHDDNQDDSVVDTVEDLPTIEVLPGKLKISPEELKKVQEQLAEACRSSAKPDNSEGSKDDQEVVLTEKNDSGKFKFTAPNRAPNKIVNKHSSSNANRKKEIDSLLSNRTETSSNVSNKSLLSFGDEDEEESD